MKYDLNAELAKIRAGVEAHSAAAPPYETAACRKLHGDTWYAWEMLCGDMRNSRPEYVAAHGEPAVQSAEAELKAIHAKLRSLDGEHGLDAIGAELRAQVDGELHQMRYLGF